MSQDMRELSKSKWTTSTSTVEDINCGSLLRIADATEVMAKNYQTLMSERDKYERLFKQYREQFLAEQRSAIALRGVITKLKNNREKVD